MCPIGMKSAGRRETEVILRTETSRWSIVSSFTSQHPKGVGEAKENAPDHVRDKLDIKWPGPGDPNDRISH